MVRFDLRLNFLSRIKSAIIYAVKNTGSSISRLVLIISSRKGGGQQAEKPMIFLGMYFACIAHKKLFKSS